MTKDQTIALVKTIQEASVFLGKCLMEQKVPNADIADDIEALDSSIEGIIADIPDDASDDSNPDNNPDDNQEDT